MGALELDKRFSGEFWNKCSDSRIEELVAYCLRQQKKRRERGMVLAAQPRKRRERRGAKRFPTDRYGPHVREKYW